MPSIKVGLVCNAERLPELSKRFMRFEFVNLLGAVDISGKLGSGEDSGVLGLPLFDRIDQLISLQGMQFVVEDSENEGVIKKSNCYTPFGMIVVGPAVLEKFFAIMESHKELFQLFRDMELMQFILNNVQEGIQYADRNGELRYVNPAYTKITGIDPKDRIGTSVFTLSRDGALVKALETGKPVFGLRNIAMHSKTEVVSNASPIYDCNELLGAVVVFRDISDIEKITRELKQSNIIIANLSRRLKHYQSQKFVFNDIICVSDNMLVIKEKAVKIARSDSTVLIQGESGTGKELYAHAIHHGSKRTNRPFVEVNCAAIPDHLLESELFGHEKGAFTSADKKKPGRFEMAEGGTLFLDEIGELKHEMQAKLLRVLQNKEFERVGGTETITADVRVIAATNRDLREMMELGEFREDLFYRLNVLHLEIPPLRDRKKDIPVLSKHLIKKISSRIGIQPKEIKGEALKFLQEYSWPGNVRELENLLERVLYYEEGDHITLETVSIHLEPFIKKEVSKLPRSLITLDEAEAQAIKRALDCFGRSVEGKKKAGKSLGISLATLYNKLKKHGIS
ncbi:MAG: sigma-54 interaction domain-containing protein [Bacillota bacterium]